MENSCVFLIQLQCQEHEFSHLLANIYHPIRGKWWPILSMGLGEAASMHGRRRWRKIGVQSGCVALLLCALSLNVMGWASYISLVRGYNHYIQKKPSTYKLSPLFKALNTFIMLSGKKNGLELAIYSFTNPPLWVNQRTSNRQKS